MAADDEVPQLTPDPAFDSRTDARRRMALVGVRWVLIALCVYLISDNPKSAAVLGPLLVLAIYLGRTRKRSASAQRDQIAAQDHSR